MMEVTTLVIGCCLYAVLQALLFALLRLDEAPVNKKVLFVWAFNAICTPIIVLNA